MSSPEPPVYFGTVNALKISQNTAKLFLGEDNGGSETMQLWADADGIIPDRVTQSMWVSMCRDALTTGSHLMVVTDGSDSAQIVTIELRPKPAE